MKRTDLKKQKLVMLTAGGTGGHIYPAESLAKELILRGYDVEFVTDSRGLSNYHGTLEQLKTHCLLSGALVGKSKLYKIKSLVKTCFGIIQGIWLLLKKRPDCVVSFGGYASFPCSMAAFITGVKLILHEQNSVMGRTNRLLGKFVDVVAKSFPDVNNLPANKEIVYTGMPVREQIVELHDKIRKNNGNDFQILVIGGSQGAKAFADIIPDAVKVLAKQSSKNIKVVQQCRADDVEMIKQCYEKSNIEAQINSFFGNMPQLYENSDIIISRAGASSICEILVSGIPSILVPLPTAADNHQYFNALNVADANAGILLEQKDFTVEKLSDLLVDLSENPAKLEYFSQNARKTAIIDAAKKLADTVEKNMNSGAK